MKTKFLSIDNSRTIRNLLAAALEEAGFEYHCAVDGREGVDMYPDVAPDVVITDINMPNLDGFGVIEELRGEDINSKVPILVLTTESAPELKARARNAGATGWITKPFDDASLIFALKRVTGAAA